jgi:hypothetical protein
MPADALRGYVKAWAETSRLLEELRWRELAALDAGQALAAADVLIDAAMLVPLPPTRRRWSGLADQQALFHRTKPA